MEGQDRYANGGIAEALAAVAAAAEQEPDLPSTLVRLVEGAAHTVPGADQAGIALVADGSFRTEAATAAICREFDRLQEHAGEGPLHDALKRGTLSRSDDLWADRRWPGLDVRGHEVRSAMVFALRRPERHNVGALSILSRRPHAFGDEAEHVGDLFATHAAVAVVGELDRVNLETAIGTRDLIGTAKGILMHRHTLNDQQAFDMLAAASQRANVKLRQVAAWLIDDANTRARAGRTAQD